MPGDNRRPTGVVPAANRKGGVRLSITEIVTVIVTSALTSITGALVVYIRKLLSDSKGTHKTLKQSQQALLRYQIVQAHDYFRSKGSIGKYSLSTLEELYKSYKELGGNGFVAGIMEEIREIPVK